MAGHKPSVKAIGETFGHDIDFAQLIKIYGSIKSEGTEKRFSPPFPAGTEYEGITKKPITSRPDKQYVSTSYMERQRLTMRMHMRPGEEPLFTRLTNAFGKKIENHRYAIALHFV